MATEIPSSIRAIIRAGRLPFAATRRLLLMHPYFRFIHETAETQTPITFDAWFRQNVLRVNHGPYWPVHPSSMVINWQNILIGIETSPGLMPGCYISGIGKIYIGDYTQVASQVGIISANHILEDNRRHAPSEVRIGAYGWLGMGCTILPGVALGDFTIVGAGAVVTKSAPEGYCVLAGTPARIVKRLDRNACIRHRSKHEYNGYVRHDEFDDFRRASLSI